jgi:hypothetical protein
MSVEARRPEEDGKVQETNVYGSAHEGTSFFDSPSFYLALVVVDGP